MRKIRVGYRSLVDAEENPEQARDAEIEHFLTDDMDILGRHLREAFPSKNRNEFCAKVAPIPWALINWLEPYKGRFGEKEVMMLYGIVGFLANPVPYYKRTTKNVKSK